MDSNIPTKPTYGVYISKLVRIGSLIFLKFKVDLLKKEFASHWVI